MPGLPILCCKGQRSKSAALPFAAENEKLVFDGQTLVSPYGRGAPYGGGEGPLSHGCAVTAPPKGEPRPLRGRHQFIAFFLRKQ